MGEKYDGIRSVWNPKMESLYSRFGNKLPGRRNDAVRDVERVPGAAVAVQLEREQLHALLGKLAAAEEFPADKFPTDKSAAEESAAEESASAERDRRS